MLLFSSPIILRWWQPGGYPYNFALDDVYIGPPCPDNCHRNGVCKKGACVCDTQSEGTITDIFVKVFDFSGNIVDI
jgi:hypothetical protein